MKKYDEARKDLDQCEQILDTFDSVESVVHAAFYRVSADYHQAKHEFAAYYRTTLLYLACIELESLSLEDRQRIAYDLSIAALVSDSIYDVLAAHMGKNDLLKEHQNFLYQKISLSALTETVFRRPPHDRAMTFTEIAQQTKVQPNEIEHLIMKALSLGLVRGTIDQVAEVARITWVQPKVLDKGQIVNMRERLRAWDDGVNKLGNWIESSGQEIWAA